MTDRGAPRETPHEAPSGTLPADVELDRLRTKARLLERLRDLTITFSRDVAASRPLGAALQAAAGDATALFGASRAEIWLHQRRARELTLAACSDAGRMPAAGRLPTDDPDPPAARGLRLDRAMITEVEGAPALITPLRGWRRTLGTLILFGPFSDDLDHAQRIDLGHELGRDLSAAIDSVQLLEEVRRQRRLLEDTFDAFVDLVVVTDRDLRVVQMNEAFAARVGLSRAELLDRPLDTLVGGPLAAWTASLDHIIGRPAPGEASHEVITRTFDDPGLGGTFAVTVTALVGADDESTGRVLVARDVTVAARLEQQSEILRQRLAQSEKLASLGQFVAGVAHELNNPLQGVLGHLELLIDSTEAARPVRRDLKRVYQEAERAVKIVRNLLVFTGARRIERRRLRMPRVLARVLRSRAIALSRARIDVVRTVADDLPWISADPQLLHQAFLNVLINAEHAILSVSRGGRIELEVSFRSADRRVVTAVRDSGPGIPAEVLPRMFDPFFTTKNVGQGTGLGLAITHSIVEEHGGVVTAGNAAAGGAVVTIEIPAI